LFIELPTLRLCVEKRILFLKQRLRELLRIKRLQVIGLLAQFH